MNAQATRRGVPAAALWGGFGALAWAALTVLTGGGSAQADEQSDTPLLDGVTSLVSTTLDTVGETVTAVAEPVVTQVVTQVAEPVITQVAEPVLAQVVAPAVTEVVAPAVTEVVAPAVTQVVAPVQHAAPPVVEAVAETVTQVPVVGTATAPAVAAVADTAQAVIEPVADLLQDAPVSQIVKPVQDAAASLPVVGSLLQDLGVITLLDDVVGIVDETTSLVGGVVHETVPPVLEALDPSTPGAVTTLPAPDVSLPAAVRAGGSAVSTPASVTSVVSVTSVASAASVVSAASIPLGVQESSATSALDAPAAAAPAADDHEAPLPAPPGGPCAPSSFASSGGVSPSSHAGPGGVTVPPLRAWERTSGASDDVLPTSLVADTDVSPD